MAGVKKNLINDISRFSIGEDGRLYRSGNFYPGYDRHSGVRVGYVSGKEGGTTKTHLHSIRHILFRVKTGRWPDPQTEVLTRIDDGKGPDTVYNIAVCPDNSCAKTIVRKEYTCVTAIRRKKDGSVYRKYYVVGVTECGKRVQLTFKTVDEARRAWEMHKEMEMERATLLCDY